MEHLPLCSPVSSSPPRLDPTSILLPLASDIAKTQIWLLFLSHWKLIVLLVKCKFLSMCDVVPPSWLQPVSKTQFWLFLVHLPFPNSGVWDVLSLPGAPIVTWTALTGLVLPARLLVCVPPQCKALDGRDLGFLIYCGLCTTYYLGHGRYLIVFFK